MNIRHYQAEPHTHTHFPYFFVFRQTENFSFLRKLYEIPHDVLCTHTPHVDISIRIFSKEKEQKKMIENVSPYTTHTNTNTVHPNQKRESFLFIAK